MDDASDKPHWPLVREGGSTFVAWVVGIPLFFVDLGLAAYGNHAWWVPFVPTLVVLAFGFALTQGPAAREGRGAVAGALSSAVVAAGALVLYYMKAQP